MPQAFFIEGLLQDSERTHWWFAVEQGFNVVQYWIRINVYGVYSLQVRQGNTHLIWHYNSMHTYAPDNFKPFALVRRLSWIIHVFATLKILVSQFYPYSCLILEFFKQGTHVVIHDLELWPIDPKIYRSFSKSLGWKLFKKTDGQTDKLIILRLRIFDGSDLIIPATFQWTFKGSSPIFYLFIFRMQSPLLKTSYLNLFKLQIFSTVHFNNAIVD